MSCVWKQSVICVDANQSDADCLSVQELEAVQAVHPRGITKGVHKLLRLPTVTLLVNRDIPETAVDTPEFPQ